MFRLTSFSGGSPIRVPLMAIHELSHRVGATEEEARILQFYVNQTFNFTNLQSFADVDFDSDGWQQPSASQINFNSHDPDSRLTICDEIGEDNNYLTSTLVKIANESRSTGVQFERPQALRALKAAEYDYRVMKRNLDRYADLVEGMEQTVRFVK